MSIIASDDLPERMKKRQELAHKIAERAFEETWTFATQSCHNLDNQITGNDALAYFGTLVAHFTARWIYQMDKVAKDDTAGVTTEEVVKDTINGILAMIGCSATFENEEKELPDGIKKIKGN